MYCICRCVHRSLGASAASLKSLRAPFSVTATLARKPSPQWAKEGDIDQDDADPGSDRFPTRKGLKNASESPWSRNSRLRSKYLRDQDVYDQALDLAELAYADGDNNTNTWPSDQRQRQRQRMPRSAFTHHDPALAQVPNGHDPTLSFPNRNKRSRSPSRPIPLDDLFSEWLRLENIAGKAQSVGLSQSDAAKVIRAFASSIRSMPPSASSPLKPKTPVRDVPAARSTLNHLWLQFLAKYVPHDQKPLFTALCESADLRHPKEWYPGARLLRRQIIMHVGPTNSGKTHGALAELAAAPSGVYCGPLRLLAHEIHDRFTTRGIPCSLVTGEERREDPQATITACTVEMADLGREYDVAVIDEIQVIGDAQRGWAWTQALLGLRAKRIYVCGEESAVPLVKRLLEGTGDEVIVKRFERLTPLKVSPGVVKNKLAGVQPGDCVVAFSRKEVFAYKYLLEKENPGLKCAVVYGALPPETRAEQARLFNTHRESGYGVMVATDAVGMGLNLAINRVIFTTTRKYDGVSEQYLSISALKQIAGRAGRYGLDHGSAHGTVTAFRPNDLRYIHETLPLTPPDLTSAGLQPTPDMIEAFAQQLPHEPLTGLLEKFQALARLNGEMYFMCNLDDQCKLADRLKHLKHMAIRDQYLFVLAPVNTRSESALAVFVHIAEMYARDRALPLMALLLPGAARPAVGVGVGVDKALAAWREVFTDEVVQAMRPPPKSTREAKDERARHVLELVVALAQQQGEQVHAPGATLDDVRPSHAFAPARSRDQLARLEAVHRGILLYMWLANRFEGHATFAATPRAQAEWLLRECERAINLGLKVITESEQGHGVLRAMDQSQVERDRRSPAKWGVAGSRRGDRVETEEARVVIEEV
ncbi:P-loop containing nucleoside triphosphate hydrolase protein [Catenaria anguillulae PL171]|uniref:RNA helicase n=1 Tax=Catenaria anguillulae PL171 TaxID=765915 RepID=A0A1Y2H196_9FUNG|nr:P-loop containing nucleoside triphosphate hydrolase protein [Catenaria anguillulae PL171]